MAAAKKSKTAPKDEPTYRAATEELDLILNEIEAGQTDVDVLSERVERAAELIRLCQDKITGAELKVTKVLEGLEAEDAAEATRDADLDNDEMVLED